MKNIKIIFIAMEIACLISVVILSFTNVDADAEFFKDAYISLCAILAVVIQKEQQQIDWE